VLATQEVGDDEVPLPLPLLLLLLLRRRRPRRRVPVSPTAQQHELLLQCDEFGVPTERLPRTTRRQMDGEHCKRDHVHAHVAVAAGCSAAGSAATPPPGGSAGGQQQLETNYLDRQLVWLEHRGRDTGGSQARIVGQSADQLPAPAEPATHSTLEADDPTELGDGLRHAPPHRAAAVDALDGYRRVVADERDLDVLPDQAAAPPSLQYYYCRRCYGRDIDTGRRSSATHDRYRLLLLLLLLCRLCRLCWRQR
jgi:hypothetical protein